ncbi:hypothetical protein [uncultured Sanguibacteroides sp.]|uniref:hypothetical protein n=1 Tax=uncultured Sanguibacteroides sp. TaxID=1635151 RepID=UPI0025DC6DF5|nr:hypothetical protein [uncultured Sanguibacteroides sp.]
MEISVEYINLLRICNIKPCVNDYTEKNAFTKTSDTRFVIRERCGSIPAKERSCDQPIVNGLSASLTAKPGIWRLVRDMGFTLLTI